jgi:uncharacterized lipoprotein YmbA
MNRHPLTFVLALCCAALLAGCGSSPRHNYYLLTAGIEASPSGDAPALGVGPVTIPEYLSRESMVYNRRGNSLLVSDSERWAEPLGSGIARVVALNLSGLLQTQNVRLFPWHQQRAPDVGVKISVLMLDARADEAVLVAEWVLYRPGSAEPLERRLAQVNQPIQPKTLAGDAVAPAYSALFMRLSEIIATEIRAL